MSGFAPGTQPTGDDEHFESDILQLAPDPGAGGFALSSAVEIKLAIFRQILNLFDEVVGFDANGAGNAFGIGIVVAVAPDVGDEHVLSRIGGQSLGQFFGRYAGNDVEQTVLAVDPDAIADIAGDSYAGNDFGGKAGGAQTAGDGTERVTEEKSHGGVRADVQSRADGVVLQKIAEAHFHAPGQGRRHGVDARDELGKEQSLFAATIEIFRGAQNAGFRIRRKPA